ISPARAKCSDGNPKWTWRRACAAGCRRRTGASRRVSRKFLGVCVAAAMLAAVVATPSASARPHMLVGLLDQASTFYSPDTTFPVLKRLRVQVVRADLYWGGTELAVAKKRPADATDPDDAAYNWAVYDRLATYAARYHIKLLFTIWGTPRWANHG